MTGAAARPARRRAPCPRGLLLVALSMLTPASLALAQDPLGAVRNQSVEVSGSVVTVGYELVADSPGTIFTVALDFSQNAGQTYLRARSVTGDVGQNVTSGPGKQIVWEAARDTESLAIGASSSTES